MLNAELPLLHVSRMVRPAGRGRGANDPPPPEFFAGMMQQFELNRQFMEGMMAQFPRPNLKSTANPSNSAGLHAPQPNYLPQLNSTP